MHRGRIAAETILGGNGAWDPATVAQLVYTTPEICWCGDMQDCDPADTTCVVPWSTSGLSVAADTLDGVAMIRWNPGTGTVTGVGATGFEACKLADGFTTAVEMGATLQDLADMVPSHPVQGDPLHLAAREALASS
jgi:pyruvate/2-oxoglutarate dehydrogenase complex dihydrolipoamide dehydrogenase (E3) component